MESIPDYRKPVLLRFFIQNDKNLLRETGFIKNDINRLNLEFKNFLTKEYEEYLEYVKNKEEENRDLETFLNK